MSGMWCLWICISLDIGLKYEIIIKWILALVFNWLQKTIIKIGTLGQVLFLLFFCKQNMYKMRFSFGYILQ